MRNLALACALFAVLYSVASSAPFIPIWTDDATGLAPARSIHFSAQTTPSTPASGAIMFINNLKELQVKDSDGHLVRVSNGLERVTDVTVAGTGVGPYKTTLTIHGTTAGEVFGVGDELYLHISIDPNIDSRVTAKLSTHIHPEVSEPGKTVSFDFSILPIIAGISEDVSAVSTTIQVVDVAVGPTALLDQEFFVTIPTAYLVPVPESMHIRVKRVASTTEASGIGMHHAQFEYTTLGS